MRRGLAMMTDREPKTGQPALGFERSTIASAIAESGLALPSGYWPLERNDTTFASHTVRQVARYQIDGDEMLESFGTGTQQAERRPQRSAGALNPHAFG